MGPMSDAFVIVLVPLALMLGSVWAIRIGGADMPVLISCLNALSGMAAAFCGVAVASRLLTACGAMVAASGLLLTHAMCRAMNRSWQSVLLGMAPGATLDTLRHAACSQPDPDDSRGQDESGRAQFVRAVDAMRNARRVILVPGYGLALANAQQMLVQLAEYLTSAGKDTRFGIHPSSYWVTPATTCSNCWSRFMHLPLSYGRSLPPHLLPARSNNGKASRTPGRMRLLCSAVLTSVLGCVYAGTGSACDLGLYVSARVPETSADAEGQAALLAAGKAASDCRAEGLLLMIADSSQPIEPVVTSLCKDTPQLAGRLWIAIRFDASQVDSLARTVENVPVAGVALFFAGSDASPIDMADRAALVERKRLGDVLGDAIRALKQKLGSERQVALCLPCTEMLPETSCRQYVPVHDLVRDGTVDMVCLSGRDAFNLHRLRLLRDTPLRAGLLVDAADTTPGVWGFGIARSTVRAIENPTCDCLWLVGFPAEMALRRVQETLVGQKLVLQQRQALDDAIAAGKLVVDQHSAEQGCTDQASVHGVAQRFVPSRDGVCPLVQVYVAMRGCQTVLPAPLAVEIRADADGRPADAPLATAAISPVELGHEPDYRWATARFETPVALKQGIPYWVYLPPVAGEQGSYVWRICKDTGTPECHSWSRRYDYTTHTWAFRVYLNKELPQ